MKVLQIACTALAVPLTLGCCGYLWAAVRNPWIAACPLPGTVLLLFALLLSSRQGNAAAAALRAHLDTSERLRARQLKRVQAEAAAEAERFRSILSHELRTPIAVIQSYAELLEGGMVPDEALAREYLQRIIRRSAYMGEILTRQRAAPAFGDVGPLSRTCVDLAELIRQAADDMRAAATARGISIRTELPAEPLTLEADDCLLNRVLFNLLENAVKYMGRPGSILIRAEIRDGQALLLVRDDGLGLSQEETLHIFEPCYQGSNHRSGQGQGLYLVRRIAEAHGGSAAADAAPGQGMEISVTLPLHPPSGKE